MSGNAESRTGPDQTSQAGALAQLLGLERKSGPKKSVPEFAAGMLRRAWLAVAIALVIAVPAVILVLKSPVRYQATARVLVELPNLNMPFSNKGLLVYDASPFFATRARMLRSTYVVGQVYEQLQLDDRPEFSAGVEPVRELADRIQVNRAGETNIMEVSLAGGDPVILASTVNAVVDTFIKWEASTRRQTSLKGKERFTTGLVDIKTLLDSTQRDIQGFHKDHRQFAPGGESLAGAKLAAVKAKLTVAELELEQAQTRYSEVQANGAAASAYVPSQFSGKAKGIEASLEKIDDELHRFSQILQPAQMESDPKVKALRLEREKLQSDLTEAQKEAREQVVQEAKRAVEAAQKTAKKLGDEFKKLQEEALALEATVAKYKELTDDRERIQSVYEGMAQRKIELDLAEALSQVNVEIVDRATVPKVPVGSSKLADSVKYGVLGLVLGLGLVGFLEYRDRRIRWPDQVRELLGLPVIGVLPRLGYGSSERVNGAAFAHLNPDGHLSEAFRVLFSDLRLKNTMELPRILMVTSSSPGEGKSTTSTNLAATAAIHGEKALLIDADLRNPKVGGMLGVAPDNPGLSQVLAGEMPWRDAVHHTDIERFDVISSGGVPELPTDLLGRPAFHEMLAEAAQQYRWIIIDTVPMLGVADARSVARLVDEVLLVVESDRKPVAVLQRTKETIESMGRPIAGVVLNKVSGMKTDYYYYESQYRGEYPRRRRSRKYASLEGHA